MRFSPLRTLGVFFAEMIFLVSAFLAGGMDFILVGRQRALHVRERTAKSADSLEEVRHANRAALTSALGRVP